MEREVTLKCGASKPWRRAALASSLGVAAALLLSPWLEAVLFPAAALSAASFQFIACNKERKVKVEREMIIKNKKVIVTFRGPPELEVVEFPSAAPVSGSASGKGSLTYVIDLELEPFVFWVGAQLKVEERECECSAFLELGEFASSWNLEGLGLGEPEEVEGEGTVVPEVVGVKEYSPGDDVRLIVWKTLYSPGGLRVKELKKVKEVTALKRGIRTYAIELGAWEKNSCVRAMGMSLANYLESVGMRRVKGRADVAIVAPGVGGEAEHFLLLNPAACVPPLEGFDALELLREELLREFAEAEKLLRQKGEVRGVPWSVPPRRTR